MRLLFLTGSPARYMAPPQLGERQINAGPDWSDAQGADGRWVSLQTPTGDYDVTQILARLPAEEQPDAIVALVDASWRNTPRNLGAFPGLKALLVADTHHLQSPLLGMLRYAASEPFDRVVFLYDRHHLGFFHAAGLTNLYWFPGLTFPHDDATVRTARKNRRERRIAFVGQAGKFHPRRARLLEALEAAHLPVAVKPLGQRAGLEFYGASQFGFNASLNGDLNLRVIEILASGATLFTDRLAPESGLAQLCGGAKPFLDYGSEAELVERAQAAVADPKGMAALGAAGAAWFDATLHATQRRADFQALLCDGRARAEFAFPGATPTRVFFGGDVDRLLEGLMVYEGLQELHRTEGSVRVAATAGVPDDLEALCATLPRLEVTRDEAPVRPDLTVFGREEVPSEAQLAAARLWCWNARPADLPALGSALAGDGFRLVSSDVAVLCRLAATEPAAVPGAEAAAGRRVLVFSDDPDSGGVAHYNHSLMTGLVAAGYTVSCAQSASTNPLVDKQRELGVTHFWIPYDTKKEFARTLEDKATARRIMTEARPDLVVFSDCCPVSNLAAREVARESGIPFVAVIGFVGAYLAERFQTFLPQLARQYAAARAVVAVSQENLQLLRTRFGLPRDRGQVIHYGRPARFFAPRDEAVRRRLRTELGLGDDAVLSFTAARLAAVKGYGYQIEAAKRLARLPEGERLHFAWAGDGEQRGEIERLAADSGLGSRIHLLGQRWDVADWYDAADMFVLPSEMEGMPLAIMEAMAKGLPVAATAVSGIPEELGDTGQLLPAPQSGRAALIEQLVRTWHAWTRDADLRARIGEAGRRRAEVMFQEARMIERTVGLVREHLPIAIAEEALVS